MNRRLHLMQRIRFTLPHIHSKPMKDLLENVYRTLEADESEITDLESRIDELERSLNGILPYFPDRDDSQTHDKDKK